MRRDVYIENDSGGFSVLAAEAVDAIIEDARDDDLQFVGARQAILQLLYGDDSMVVRFVADEPLRPEEEAQWLARSTGRLRTRDGHVLVMGGFDPDVLTWWRDETGGTGDGRGVASFRVPAGEWQVDLYAHVGSMNGRAILSDTGTPPGAAFRRHHPGRPFPLWLAHMLDFSGEDDPGHEKAWRDLRGSIARGQLAVDTAGPHAVGMLVHLTRAQGAAPPPPEDGWFAYDHGSRAPEGFPLGLAAEVPDAGLRDFQDRLLGRERPPEVRPIAEDSEAVIDEWNDEEPEAIADGPVPLPLADLYLLHWIAAMSFDGSTRFELRIEADDDWQPPAATPDYAVRAEGEGAFAIGPVRNTGGWHTWWTSRDLARALPALPDGTRLDLAIVPQLDDAWGDDEDEGEDGAGRARYRGEVRGGQWQLDEAAPAVTGRGLADALTFLRQMLQGRIRVRSAGERSALEREAEMFAMQGIRLTWDGDLAIVDDEEVRSRILLAQPVFRLRFAAVWPMDTPEDEDDEDDTAA